MMRYTLYYPIPDDQGRVFASPERFMESTYQPMYAGEITNPTRIAINSEPEAVLEEAFCIFNSDARPVRIRSLSVGDIVVLDNNGVWLCDRCGWTLLAADHIPQGVTV